MKYYILLIILLIIGLVIYFTKRKHYDEQFYVNKNYSIQNFYSKTVDLKISQKIPLKIHQTYIDNTLPVSMYESCMINKNMNSEYDYFYYNDDMVKSFIKDNYPQEYLDSYLLLKPGAFKADFFRYLLLYKEGGVYIDCKSYTIKPLREFIPSDSDFVSFRDRPKGTVMNGFMACTSNHPILKICIDMVMDNIKNRKYGINSLDITGPQTLGRAYNKYIGNNELDDIKVDNKNIIGSFIIINDNYQALADSKNVPLVNRVCQNYYSILNYFNTYTFKWATSDVFQ